MRVRKMQLKDVLAVYDLASKEERFKVSSESCFWSVGQLNLWTDSEGDVCLVAEEDGEIAGFILSQYHKPTGKATIENLFVKEECRDRRIGKELFHRCSLALKKNGATYQCGMVEPDNDLMFDIAKSAGFDEGKTFVWIDKNETT
jgi:ribosomal protein S18 acetylase RimI-like enzyme